jgi:ABC-2 type transport system permease protein
VSGSNRKAVAFGGFNFTYLSLELLRRIRNPRALFFTLLFPVLMYYIVGYKLLNEPLTKVPLSAGGPSVAAYIMVSMALYGASMSATQTGSTVALERAQGWSRQLRLTPLNPVVNILVKMLAGMAFGLVAVLATFVAGAVSGLNLELWQWLVCGLSSWLLASAVFTTLGLLVGYLVPGDSAAQITSLITVLLSFLGGLFFPIDSMPDALHTVAKFTPMYGIGQIARAPITGDSFDLGWLINVLVWIFVFVMATSVAFKRDTKRG